MSFEILAIQLQSTCTLLAPYAYVQLVRRCRSFSRRVRLGNAFDRRLPSESEQVMSAKSAPIGLEQPVKRLLHGVPDPYTPDLDRFAVCTTSGEQPQYGADHDAASDFTGVEYRLVELLLLRVIPRLDSRAAFNCSGVLKSGCDSFTRSLARDTLRLWRFSNLLFIGSLRPLNVVYSLATITGTKPWRIFPILPSPCRRFLFPDWDVVEAWSWFPLRTTEMPNRGRPAPPSSCHAATDLVMRRLLFVLSTRLRIPVRRRRGGKAIPPDDSGRCH